MSLFVIYLFTLFIGLAVVIYLLSTSKEPLWGGHSIEPNVVPEKKAELEEGYPSQESWTMSSIKQEFDQVKDQIYQLDAIQEKPSPGESLKGFLSYVWYSWKLMWKEKEIFTFALLQWAAIGAGYYLWVRMLSWIPPEVWKSTEHSRSGSIADIVLLAWSFVCVGVVAYPLSIFTACMGAVHFINRQGRSSSIAECLKIVLPKVWPLWFFTWTDSWITVNQILKRLPKKNDRTSPAERALSEALYLAWKVGTIGILPGLITGRGLVESCRQSIAVVRNKFKEIMKLRLGYSALCWVVGVSAYIGTIVFFFVFHNLVPHGKEALYGHVYTFYFWAGIPILIAVSIVQIILRPMYVISACHIYSDYLNEKEEKIMLPRPPSKSKSALVAFCVLLIILAVVFLYRDQLGITKMLSTEYGEEFHF
jgi:hypothetical protein